MSKTLYIIRFLLIFLSLVAIPAVLFASTIVSDPIDVSVSASVGDTVILSTNDNSGGSGIPTSITFSGFAYPGATVHVWKDARPEGSTVADSTAYFHITLDEIYSPNALYTIYAIDKEHRRSILLNYPIVVKKGYVTQISGIVLAPTVSTDKTEIKFGDYITVSGYAMPEVSLDVVIEGVKDSTYFVTSNKDGKYRITIPLLGFPRGDYNLHTNYKNDKRISKVIKFTIGDVNVQSTELTANIPGDCNSDQIINIVDFSVAAFWYGKPNPPRCVDTNNDNIINLIDFSILAFYWTG